MESNVKIGVIGCGKMATAILTGIANKNFINSKNIYLYDINSASCNLLKDKFNFNVCLSIDKLVKACDILFLAIKPFKVDEVLSQIKPLYNNQLIISILAGVKIKRYTDTLNNARVVRIMPNTPALVQEGMSAVCASSNTSMDEYDFVVKMISNCGKVIKITEDKIDVITALSGSGPAYYFKIIDLMAKAAYNLGLDYNDAILLSSQTALGSAKMLIENDFDVNQLIKNVTTPGGCTEIGNNVLAESDIDKILYKTIEDTMKKAADLGK